MLSPRHGNFDIDWGRLWLFLIRYASSRMSIQPKEVHFPERKGSELVEDYANSLLAAAFAAFKQPASKGQIPRGDCVQESGLAGIVGAGQEHGTARKVERLIGKTFETNYPHTINHDSMPSIFRKTEAELQFSRLLAIKKV